MPVSPSEKPDFRRRAKALLRELTAEQRSAESRTLCQKLAPLADRDDMVLAFWPLPSEPDIRPLLAEWLRSGVRVCLPRVDGDLLSFHAIEELDGLETSSLGIGEPPADCPAIDSALATLLLVPGLAFTPGGDRLGRGGGFYDRLLAGLSEGVRRVGLAFACQVLEAIPTESHDAVVDELLLA